MRTELVLTLIVLSSCSFGGWKQESLYSNSAVINNAYNLATEKFLKNNGISSVDDLELLSIYSQLVAGMNYKFTYINRNNPLNGIQQTTVYIPLPTSNAQPTVTEDKTLPISNGVISLNDPKYGKVNELVKNAYKNSSSQKIIKTKKITFVNTDLATYFILVAENPNKEEGYYAVVLHRGSGEYQLINKL